jgi:hypothetical protein
MLRAPLLLLLVLVFAAGGIAREANVEAVGNDIVRAREVLNGEYAARLAELAAWCRERELAAAAEQLQSWLPERDPEKLTLFVLPPSEVLAESDKTKWSEWRAKWQGLRDRQAEALMSLAKRAVGEHHPSLAFELVTDAVRENPDHKQARRMLGYSRFRDAWRTPFEVKQLAAGKVWHEKFGWLLKAHLERYDKGDRYYRGRWLPAAEEAELRHDLAHGWRVESEHYVVTTNHSLEEGVRLSRRLELLYGVWQQAFVAYPAGEAEVARRLEGRPPRREPSPHNVVYYRSRKEYNDALRSAQPKIEITLGIYFASTRTAYFFAGDDQEPGTLYHEATHQLFQETRAVAPDVGREANFWIVEGIACYMESLAEHAGYCTLGGANAGRMPAARHRLVEDKFYVPLAELVQFGLESLQHDPRIATLYSQSSGLADFFMHVGQGRYRDALVRYFDAVYSGTAGPRTLAELTGASYETLDRQYRQFMSPVEPAGNAAAR